MDDGKVVHLVVRPTGVPHNPANGNYLVLSEGVCQANLMFLALTHFCLLLVTIIDDPNASRDTHTRGFPRPPRHPTGGGGASRFPAMEGYAFITLDTTMGEMADPSSVCYNFFFYSLGF